MKTKLTLALSAILTASVNMNAGEIDGGAVLGSVVGAAAGSAIGSANGGKNGAIIGGGVGGALGAAVGSSHKQSTVVREEKVIYVDREYHDNGKHKGHHKHRHDD